MKKIIILMLLALSTTIGYSQEIKVELPDSTALTTMKVYEDVKAGLSGLAEGLKTTAEHVYIVLVKQQVVYSIGYAIIPLLLIISIIICFKASTKSKWDDSYCNKDDTNSFNRYAAVTIIFGIISFVLLIVFLLTVQDMITGFINPEYGAIKEIMSFVK